MSLRKAVLRGGLTVEGDSTISSSSGDLALGLVEAEVGARLRIGTIVSGVDARTSPPIVEGRIDLSRARVSGGMALSGRFRVGPGAKYLIAAAGVAADGDLDAQHCLFEGGELSFRNAHINGIVNFEGAHLIHHSEPTLNLHQATVVGNVRLNSGFRSEGLVVLNRAGIGGRLRCDGGTFHWRTCECGGNPHLLDVTDENPFGCSFEAISAIVRGGVELGWNTDAGVDLTDVSTSYLADRPLRDWPFASRLDGLTYTRFGVLRDDAGLRSSFDSLTRAAWLERAAPDDPQPWAQAARVLREHGDLRGAEVVMMHWERVSRERRGWGARVWSRVQRFLTGYGYRPQRILRALATLAVLALGVLSVGASWGARAVPTGWPGGQEVSTFGSVTPSCPATTQPCYNAVLYAIETVVPLVDLGQRSSWAVQHDGGVVPILLGLLTITGWSVSTIAIATVAALGRRSE